jgi:hypothetical protein
LSRITREAKEALANDPWITVYTVDNGKIHKRYVNPDLAFARVMGSMAEAIEGAVKAFEGMTPTFVKLGEAFSNFGKAMGQTSFSEPTGV